MRRTCLLVIAAAGVLGACHRTNALLAPTPEGLDVAGPDSFVARVTTTRGPFDLKVHRDWSPRGADRLYFLFTHQYYDGVRFFRVVPDFVVQFGMSGDTAVTRTWRERRFADDTVRRGNVRGTLTFAMGGPNTRTTQLFININKLRDNRRLDAMGFSVVAQVVAGMDVVDSLYQGYGEGPPRGQGPSQDRIAKEGEAYLAAEFPKLDQIVKARVVQRWKR